MEIVFLALAYLVYVLAEIAAVMAHCVVNFSCFLNDVGDMLSGDETKVSR